MRFTFIAVVWILALNPFSPVGAAQPPALKFRAVDVDTKIEIGYGLAIADVDGDGKPDILLADKKQFVWYRNPSWEKFVLAENLTKEDNVCIAAADIDGDGKCEIAVGAGWNPGDTVNSGAVFYLIPPKDRTQKWEAVKLPHEPTVHRMKWLKNAAGKFDLVVVPLHGRGNKNGVGDGVKVLAYTMPADPRQEWRTTVIDDSMHMTHNLHPSPIAKGAPPGFFLGGREGIAYLSPPKARVPLISTNGPDGATAGVGELRTGSTPSGNLFIATVEPMHGNQLVVYSDPTWKRTVLDEALADGHALACGDLLKTGSDQIVVGWRAMNRPGVKVGIKLFSPLDPAGASWTSTIIDDNTVACEDLVLADLNGDGRLDIIAAGRATKNVRIFWNEGR